MIIDNSTLSVGGNSIKVWFGNLIIKIGNKLKSWGLNIFERNKTRYITNPSAKLYNPFTLVISFTVDVQEKWQIVIQGDYKQRYKDCVDGMIDLTDEEMFRTIHQNQHVWFKKE